MDRMWPWSSPGGNWHNEENTMEKNDKQVLKSLLGMSDDKGASQNRTIEKW